jgi:hypothetical protein
MCPPDQPIGSEKQGILQQWTFMKDGQVILQQQFNALAGPPFQQGEEQRIQRHKVTKSVSSLRSSCEEPCSVSLQRFLIVVIPATTEVEQKKTIGGTA